MPDRETIVSISQFADISLDVLAKRGSQPAWQLQTPSQLTRSRFLWNIRDQQSSQIQPGLDVSADLPVLVNPELGGKQQNGDHEALQAENARRPRLSPQKSLQLERIGL